MFNILDKIPVRTSVAVEQNLIIALPCLILLLVLTVSRRRGKSAGYLVSICLLWAYLLGFASLTIWKPWPLEFRPGGLDLAEVHIVPALLEKNADFRLQSVQVWGNFLACVPFGVAFPFVVDAQTMKLKWIVVFGLGLALAPEVAQLFWNAFIDTFASRSVDIDDVWLCFTGTLVGYALLWLLARFYVRLGFTRGARLPIWNHFHDVLMRFAPKPVSVSPSTPTIQKAR